MKQDIEDKAIELIELGSASSDTQGNDIYLVEGSGFMPKHGISND